MKKIISLLLIVSSLLTAAALIGCEKKAGGSDETGAVDSAKTIADVAPSDIMTAIVAAYPDIPSQKALYVSGVGEDDEGYLDPEYASYLYTGQYELAPEIAMLDSYAIRLPDGKSAFELHILKVADEANVAAVKTMLEKRIEIIKSGDIELYDPAGYKATMPNAKVYTYGKYVMLIITTDNTAAVAAAESKLYS